MDHDYTLHNPKKRKYKQTEARKYWNSQRNKTRINISVAFPKWRELRENLGLDRDSALACVLIDSFLKGGPSTSTPCKKSGKPRQTRSTIANTPLTREVGCQCITPVMKSVAVQVDLSPKRPKRRSKAIQVTGASASSSDEDESVKSESSYTSTAIKRPRMKDSPEWSPYSSEEQTEDTPVPNIIPEEDIKLEPCDSSYIIVTI